MANKKRVCYVVCYKDPDYIRTLTLTDSLKQLPEVDLLVIKNKHRSVLRYLEVPFRLLWTRLRYSPDIFIVGFRGHDIFWALYPSMTGKKIVFDEFINLHDWLVNEHRKLKPSSWQIKLIDGYMKGVIERSEIVLEDSETAIKLSRETYGSPKVRFVYVPVGTDEKVFYPRPNKIGGKKFEVFFYGNMLPLHGLEVILESIVLLKERARLSGFHFTIAGGRGNSVMINKIEDFIKLNGLSNFVTYKQWIEYTKLPDYIASANVCLGGPFGNTGQARRVVTGKTYQFLAMGKPTIIGDNKVDNRLKDKKNCLMVVLGSAQQLAEKIEWALSNRSSLTKIGQAGRQLYEKHYSVDAISKILEKDAINAR